MGDMADYYREQSVEDEAEELEFDRALEEARENGFRDCEDLVIAWLERKAAEKPAGQGRGRMSFELRSAALAIRLGEHRQAQDGEGK